MSDTNLPEDNSPLGPLGYLRENLAAWTVFNQRAASLWMQQLQLWAQPREQGGQAETLTAEMLRTLSDFNLRHWQNTARALDAVPGWMRLPSVFDASALTDWFDGVRRSQQQMTEAFSVAVPDDMSEAPEVLSSPLGAPDDLTRIKGIGPRLSAKLNELGIFHFRQIAAWQSPQAAWVEDYLAFKGRVTREDWIGQARRIIANGSSTVHSRSGGRCLGLRQQRLQIGKRPAGMGAEGLQHGLFLDIFRVG